MHNSDSMFGRCSCVFQQKELIFLDTGTHVVMGVAICGLALSDPIVSADAVTTSAVFSGIVDWFANS